MSEILGIGFFCIIYVFLVAIAFSTSILLGLIALLFAAPTLVVFLGALGVLK